MNEFSFITVVNEKQMWKKVCIAKTYIKNRTLKNI